MRIFISLGRGVDVVHYDWRTDSEAVTHPWGVRSSGVVVGRFTTAGDAGSLARCGWQQRACKPQQHQESAPVHPHPHRFLHSFAGTVRTFCKTSVR